MGIGWNAPGDGQRGSERHCAHVFMFPGLRAGGVWHTAAIRDSVVWVKEQLLVAPLAALHPVVPCHWTEEGIWEGAIPPCALHLSHQVLSFLPVCSLYLIPCNVLVTDSFLIAGPYIPAMTLPYELRVFTEVSNTTLSPCDD